MTCFPRILSVLLATVFFLAPSLALAAGTPAISIDGNNGKSAAFTHAFPDNPLVSPVELTGGGTDGRLGV